MSRGQRELSIAQRRRRRHISSVRSNVNDLVGIPWKEERDLRKAIYDSLRDQHLAPSHHHIRQQNRSKRTEKKTRKTESIKTERLKTVEGGISTSPHPRKSRPLPGSLSHQFLLTSSYSRSFALLSLTSDAVRRSLARATATAKSRPKNFTARGCATRKSLKQRRAIRRRVCRSANTAAAATAQREAAIKKEDVLEVLVEGDDGEFVSQIVPNASARNRSTSPKTGQPAETRPCLPSQPPSTAALPPALWQDSQGSPVDTHDFVDFLCYYGTPCLTEKLAWFADPPGRRLFTTGCTNVVASGGGSGSGKLSVPSTTTVLAPMSASTPNVYNTTPHKKPVFVARKTASIVSHPLNASAVTASLAFCEPSANSTAIQPNTQKGNVCSKKKRPSTFMSRASSSSSSPSLCILKQTESTVEKGSPGARSPVLTKKEEKPKTRMRSNRNLFVGVRKSDRPGPSSSTLSRSLSPSVHRSGLRSQVLRRTRWQQRLRSH